MQLCTECTDTVRESALKVDWEKNPLPHQGIEPALAACQSMLYHLSYIPSPVTKPLPKDHPSFNATSS